MQWIKVDKMYPHAIVHAYEIWFPYHACGKVEVSLTRTQQKCLILV